MPAIVYDIDPAHSSAQFSVRHMMISNVKGEFTKVSGTVAFDTDNPADSKVEATIDVSSLHTRDEQRDGHLKSPDFFDAEKFPTMTFRSSRVTRQSTGAIAVSGPLTIHGVTKEVEFEIEGPTPPIKDPWGNTRIGVNATTKIDRRDYGLTFNTALETGGVLVGEEVHITLELEFVQAA